jgi:hypothetical protein
LNHVQAAQSTLEGLIAAYANILILPGRTTAPRSEAPARYAGFLLTDFVSALRHSLPTRSKPWAVQLDFSRCYRRYEAVGIR